MTIGIIGFGNFGSLLASILKKHAEIRVYHYKNNKEFLNKAKIIGAKFCDLKTTSQSDIVIIAVPISKTEGIIKNISQFIEPNAIVMDVCSVKIYPCRWLKKYIPVYANTIGTHPMFGPATTNFNLKKQVWNLKEHQIVLCPVNISEKKLKEVKKLFKNLGLKIIQTTPKEHDRQNAATLGLVHFLGRSLWKAGIREQEIFTPGFKDLLKIYRHTMGDTWRLFYDMNNYNPYAKKIRRNFLNSCQKIEGKIIDNNDSENVRYLGSLIDETDNKITDLLLKRSEYAKKIGLIKKGKR